MLSNRAITQRATVMKPRPRLLLFLFVSHFSLNSSVTPHPYNTFAGACISAVHIHFSVLMIVMWMPEAETEHNCTSKWLLPVGCSVRVFVCMCVYFSVFFPLNLFLLPAHSPEVLVSTVALFLQDECLYSSRGSSLRNVRFENCCYFLFLTSRLGKRLRAASCASPWRAVLLNRSIAPLNTAVNPFNPHGIFWDHVQSISTDNVTCSPLSNYAHQCHSCKIPCLFCVYLRNNLMCFLRTV